MKKIPMRKCVATNVQLPKKELVRIVRTPENIVVIDLKGKENGRGAYLQKSLEAIEIAQKKGSLNKALEVQVPQEIYDQLKDLVNNG